MQLVTIMYNPPQEKKKPNNLTIKKRVEKNFSGAMIVPVNLLQRDRTKRMEMAMKEKKE